MSSTDFIDLDDLPLRNQPGLKSQNLSAHLALSAQPIADPEMWVTPDLALLGSGRRAAPEFPVDLLGSFWSDWTQRRAQGASAPIDYVGVALMASIGAAIANVRWPLAGANWSEPPLLWCGLVGSPSSGKSPSMDAAFSLVHHAEEEMAADFDEIRMQYETKRQVAKATRENWEAEVKAAIKAAEHPRAMPAEAEIPEAPLRPRIRVADATMEAMAKLASVLPRGLLLVRDELSGWLGSFDKYGGGGADRAFAVEMYGGRSYVVDRVKCDDPIRIAHLSVGVLGGVQPDKLSAVLTGPDDGFAARVLWSWPEVIPEFKLAREVASEVDARRAFSRLANLAMGSDEFGAPEPKRLPLDRDAEFVLEQFAKEVGKRAGDAFGILAGALGKARGHLMRLAAVLEHLWWCGETAAREPESISHRAVVAAAALLDSYFIPMAERVLGDAAIPEKERLAMILARRLQQAGAAEFNARELRREIGGALREPDAMNAACNLLSEAGLIRPRFARAGDSKGRVARNFEVNPLIVGDRR